MIHYLLHPPFEDEDDLDQFYYENAPQPQSLDEISCNLLPALRFNVPELDEWIKLSSNLLEIHGIKKTFLCVKFANTLQYTRMLYISPSHAKNIDFYKNLSFPDKIDLFPCFSLKSLALCLFSLREHNPYTLIIIQNFSSFLLEFPGSLPEVIQELRSVIRQLSINTYIILTIALKRDQTPLCYNCWSSTSSQILRITKTPLSHLIQYNSITFNLPIFN